MFENKDFVKHLEDLKYKKVPHVFPNLLTLEEEAVLRYYTTNAGYKNLNRSLRGEIEMTKEFRVQERLMNKALDKLPNYESSSLLYRIEYLSESQIEKYYKINEIVTNKHFTSSSYDPDAIGKAMRKRAYTVLIRIESKNGKLIEPISTLQIEKEVVFKSKTTFFVKDIKITTSPEDYVTPIKTIILKEL
nr:ADP-ribosyltransferase [Flavobacterium sp. 9AF]